LVFELRHNFFQTQQLFAFFKNYKQQAGVVEPNASGVKRLIEIADYTLVPIGQALGSIQFPFPRWELIYVFLLLVFLIYLVFFRQIAWRQAKFKIFLGLILGTFLFYLVLPAKSYYFVALIPVWLVLTADLVKTHLPKLVKPIIIIWLILALFQLRIQFNRHQKFAKDDSFLLASKLGVLKNVYELSGNEPFAVYHFTPEIYDFTYQFIHRYLKRQGYQTPREFSYAPGKTAYLSQVVPELVKKTPENLPKNIFLVVEQSAGGRAFAFDSWWSQVMQDYDISEEIEFNQALTIYRLKESE
jgi:hypothetical protein